jgi:hypothetical protein
MQQPRHPLVAELLKVPVYSGARAGIEELRAWHRQGKSLAIILERWNRDLGKADELFVAHTGSEPALSGGNPI